jgi:Amt family ammonium transporter
MGAEKLAGHVFMTTSLSAAACLLSWLLMDVIVKGKPSIISACTGILAGLVAITPAAGYVSVWASIIIGLTAGPVCYIAIVFVKKSLRFDDALDAFGCHGVGGIWGGLMTGVFANPEYLECLPGIYLGGFKQFLLQIPATLLTIVISIVGTLICVWITRLITPLRVEKRDELVGLDTSEHGEIAYPSFTGLD